MKGGDATPCLQPAALSNFDSGRSQPVMRWCLGILPEFSASKALHPKKLDHILLSLFGGKDQAYLSLDPIGCSKEAITGTHRIYP